MNLFILDIIKRYSRFTILFWVTLILLDVLMRHFLKQEGAFWGSVFSIGIASFTGSTMMAQTRWMMFWRRTSESIRQFWITIAVVLLFNVMLNFGCYFVSLKLAGGIDIAIQAYKLSYADIFWITLILISLNFVMLMDYKIMQANQSLKPARQAVMMIGVYVWLILAAVAIAYSKLLGYAFVEVSLLAYFGYNNSFLNSSILPKVRNRILIIGVGFVILSAATFILIEKNKNTPSSLLGKLDPQELTKNWGVSDLEKVTTVPALLEYFRNYRDSNSSELMQAIQKIELLCPRETTDYPACITCWDKELSYPNGIAIGSKIEDGELHRFLDSQSEYAKLIGLLGARRFDAIPPDIQKKIENISNQPGNLSPVALKTLAQHGKDKDITGCIRVLKLPK